MVLCTEVVERIRKRLLTWHTECVLLLRLVITSWEEAVKSRIFFAREVERRIDARGKGVGGQIIFLMGYVGPGFKMDRRINFGRSHVKRRENATWKLFVSTLFYTK